MKHKTPKSKQAEWERGWIERNRLLKTLGLPKITLDQYIAELHGTVVTQPKEFRTYTPLAHVAPRARSGKQLTGSCTKTQSPTYTGTKIVVSALCIKVTWYPSLVRKKLLIYLT